MSKNIKSRSIDDLPPEILVQIFSSFAKSEGHAKLYTILAKVSPKWLKTALARSLWTEVSFSTEDFMHEDSWLKDKDIREQLSFVKTLNFKHASPFPGSFAVGYNALKQILQSSENLENFSFDCSEAVATLSFSFDLPKLCPNIRELQIKKIFRQANENVLIEWIRAYHSNLTKLVLHDFSLIRSTQSSLSETIAEYCPYITHLELEMASSDLHIDLNSLQASCTKMRYLSLKNAKFTDNDDLISCFLQLEKFCFKPVPFTFYDDTSQQEVIRALRGSKELKELELVDVNLKAETMLQLPCKSLRKLHFQCHQDDTEELYSILCRWKHSLTEVDALCDETSMQSLFRYIEQYGKDNLESISLRCYSISKEQIQGVLRQCTKLKFLLVIQFGNLLEGNLKLTTAAQIRKWLND